MRNDRESGEFRYGKTMIEVPMVMQKIYDHITALYPGTIFRANHASNYMNLRGELNRGIPEMIRQIEYAEKTHSFRPDSLRGL